MASSLIVAASALLSFATAAPLQDGSRSGSLEARQAPSCNIGTQIGSTSVYDSSCWDTLDIMPYLTNWKANTPTCTDAETSAGQTMSCCGASEPWSTCFLRLATRQLNAYDCTQISLTTCSLPARLDPNLDPTIASQVNYVVLNIVMINNFFVSYYNALQNAVSKEGASLNSLLSSSVVSQLKPANVGVNSQNVMAALTLGLAFPEFSTPKIVAISNDGTTVTTSVNKRDPQDPNTGTSSSSAPPGSPSIVTPGCGYSWLASYYQNDRHHRRQVAHNCPNGTHAESDPNAASNLLLDSTSPPVVIFNQALQQAPNVASAMWPSPPNPATETLAALASGNIGGTASFAPILTAGLALIMSDIGTFIAFAGNGIFSTPLSPTDEASGFSTGFTGALDTYILSQILASNSTSATPGSIVTTNPCSNGASGGSLCQSSYWSPVTQRQYSFTGANTYSVLTAAVGSTEADLGVLFDGAYNCTFAGLAGRSVVGLKADNSLNVACLSVLPMYIKGGCPEGATYVRGKCPFGKA